MGARKKDKKEAEYLGPAAFVQLSMPFWEAVLETDTPDFLFQPVKVAAQGQIQAAALFNKRCLACLELPQKLAACRSPDDFMQVNQKFLQDAMRDYADAVHVMVGTLDQAAVSEPSANANTSKVEHDYLPLTVEEPRSEATLKDAGEDALDGAPDGLRRRSRPNSVVDGFEQKNLP